METGPAAQRPSVDELRREFDAPLQPIPDGAAQQENPGPTDPAGRRQQMQMDSDLYDDVEMSPTQIAQSSKQPPSSAVDLGSSSRDDESSKRFRNDDNPPSDASSEEEREHDRDIMQMQLETITVLPSKTADRIASAAFSLHEKWLMRGRQNAEMLENIEAKRVPKLFTSNAKKVTFGQGAEAMAQAMEEEELQHHLKMSGIMAQGKKLEANDFERQKHVLLEDNVNKQMARMERILSLHADMYNRMDMKAARKAVTRQIQMLIAQSQVKAALSYDEKTRAREEKHEKAKHSRDLEARTKLRNETQPLNRNEVEDIISARTADLAARLKESERMYTAQLRLAGKQTAKKAADNKKVKQQQKQQKPGKGKGKKGKGKGRGKEKYSDPTIKDNSRSIPLFRGTVINLTDTQPPPMLLSILELGPGFRPTPKPVTDKEVTSSLIQFAGSIRTRAHFTLNPTDDTDYNPKLYEPSGLVIDPDLPALDTALFQYETEVKKAMESTPSEYGPPNTTYAEREQLSLLNTALRDGSSELAVCKADKDAAFVLLNRPQFISMWQQHYPANSYPLVDPDSIDWRQFQRAVRREVQRALKTEVISSSVARFLTHCAYGTVRIPKGAILVKTHKPMNRTQFPPAKSRMYVDTVMYITTPLATFLSVHLTPARDNIIGRVKDSREFVSRINNIVFPQDVTFILMDIVDFYPNTDTVSGRITIGLYSPPHLKKVMLAFSDVIHGTLYQWTPEGLVKVADRYGMACVILVKSVTLIGQM